MNYGIPYMGSKSGIVSLIQYILDRCYKAEYFIDVLEEKERYLEKQVRELENES